MLSDVIYDLHPYRYAITLKKWQCNLSTLTCKRFVIPVIIPAGREKAILNKYLLLYLLQ